MSTRHIPYYADYISDKYLSYLLEQTSSVDGVEGLSQIGEMDGLETKESLTFVRELYNTLRDDLNTVLNQRIKDRQFIDTRTKSCVRYNKENNIDLLDDNYKTVIGLEDEAGRLVIGPRDEYYAKTGKGEPIAPLPEFMQGHHVTLFGPPDSARMSINAMNAYHRKLPNEPEVIAELLKTHTSVPKWGADDEDSKTPMRQDLVNAGVNLTACLDKSISFKDERKGKEYKLADEKLSKPVKRFPGLALPCFFLFSDGNPIPLHIYDFAVHFFANWNNPEALAFYVPKLENEEEAAYLKLMFESAEKLIQKDHSEYQIGTIRCLCVLENPRAILRANEMMDELYPYFAGASLGWHDYLGSTARLFKEDPNYRIPVKADPDIVIKYIKGSHNLLADVVGSRGGIKIGGMYGILPTNTDLKSDSFQITLRGFIRDVITQMKRDLSGFWVAHPDFVRLGLAFIEAWKFYKAGDKDKLFTMVKSLLDEKYHQEVIDFIEGPDIEGLNVNHPRYARQLLAADIKESDYISNSDPREIRYNVFQSLQYITDWLCGNGCVALPTQIDGVAARVMDDLATAERSRWEVWHEIYHGRFELEDFLKICHEELNFIRRDLSDEKKIVQIKYTEENAKWYEVAFKLMIKLMTDQQPAEFATELLLPFTVRDIRNNENPWQKACEIDANKFSLNSHIERFNYYFEICGDLKFAHHMAQNLVVDEDEAKELILGFTKEQIINAASFHGDIGQSKKNLDHMAKSEQSAVVDSQSELLEWGQKYKDKFGIKFLVSAKGKSGSEMLEILKDRFENTEQQELGNARSALWEISQKRFEAHPLSELKKKISNLLKKHRVKGAQISIDYPMGGQTLCFGSSDGEKPVTESTLFEIASLSKTIGSCFAINYFESQGISLDTPVNELLSKTKSKFRITSKDGSPAAWADKVLVKHLMGHNALNMHYVNGIDISEKMPRVLELLEGSEKYGYERACVINEPGKVFKYSGAGFLVLEHLIGELSGKSINEMTRPFLDSLGLDEFTFVQSDLPGYEYAKGFTQTSKQVGSGRLMFPAFAAGAMATSENVNRFLHHLMIATQVKDSWQGISHSSAMNMLYGRDLGCMQFMGCKMGLGIFIAEAGDNKIVIHQGANDGFRAVYCYCVEGPDAGKGFTILSNGELNSVLFNSEVAQLIFEELDFNGIDYNKFIKDFDPSGISQEEVVNIGYKKLVFDAFEPQLPEAIERVGEKVQDDYIKMKIGTCSNQKFARAENLIADYEPEFDPALFGRQGKIMDSWESARHNESDFEILFLDLETPCDIAFVSLSTKYHLGNQVESVEIEALVDGTWRTLLNKTDLQGHALLEKTIVKIGPVEKVMVKTYPDGGLSRLRLYSDIPREDSNQVYKEEIPKVVKASGISFNEDELDVKYISASNEHYGSAKNIVSPYPPINMFDGFESARSRSSNHHEEVVIGFKKRVVKAIEIDFTFFVNNNPKHMQFLGRVANSMDWVEITDKVFTKPFAGNFQMFNSNYDSEIDQIKILVYPDGGFNRIRIY